MTSSSVEEEFSRIEPSGVDNDIYLIRGEILGSLFTIAFPSNLLENSKKPFHVLIHAHGCRPEGIPLEADLNVESYKKLIKDEESWIVCMPSYRREGAIIEDAIEDIKNLRQFTVNTFGGESFLKKCVIEGESMGGCISTLISERYPNEFDGAISNCPALYSTEKNQTLEQTFNRFSYAPKIPLIFLINESELGQTKHYMSKLFELLNSSSQQPYNNSKEDEETDDERFSPKSPKSPFNPFGSKATQALIPAYWTVEREGHCNVNNEERYHAIQKLLEWLFKGYCDEMEKSFTMIPSFKPSTCTFLMNEKTKQPYAAVGRILNIDVYGDMWLSITVQDMAALQIGEGRRFMIEFGERKQAQESTSTTTSQEQDTTTNQKFEVYYGSSYNSFNVNVEQGKWLAYPDAEGYVVVCINYSYVYAKYNAAKTVQAFVGETVTVEQMPIPRPNRQASSKLQSIMRQLQQSN